MATFASLRLPALALLCALTLPTALADGDLRVDAAAAPFSDGVDAVGIDLAWDGDLVLVLDAAGVGALGDAIVPVADGLPTDAMGRVVTVEALERSGVIIAAPGSAAFLLDGTDTRTAAATFAARLADLGFRVDATSDGRVLTFDRDGFGYRATFGTHDTGVQVYVGAL